MTEEERGYALQVDSLDAELVWLLPGFWQAKGTGGWRVLAV